MARRPLARLAGQRGSVTAETAVVLPSLLLILAVLLWAAAAATAQLQCVDAARAGARALARGEAVSAARAAAAQAAPRGAAVQLSAAAEDVRVDVHAEVRPFAGLLAGAPAVQVHGRATAPVESFFGDQP